MPTRKLDSETTKEVVDLISKHCQNEAQRRSLLTSALGIGHELLTQFDYTGDAVLFATLAAAKLLDIDIDARNTGLWALLLKIRPKGGLDDQARIDALENNVNFRTRYRPKPIRTTIDLRIEALFRDLEEAERRGAWLVVCGIGDQILGLDSTHRLTIERTANAYYEQALSEDIRTEYDRRIKYLTSAIALIPDIAEYHGERGWAYHWRDELDRALADYSRAIELDGENPDWYYLRGVAHKHSGDKKAARKDLQQAADMGHKAAQERLGRL